MRFDLATLPENIGYKLLVNTITPRPIAWVSTRGADGISNLAPYSFFNGMGGAPPVVALGITQAQSGGLKDSSFNIRHSGEFAVNLVTEALGQAMNASSAAVARGVSEFALAKVTEAACQHIAAPRVAESPVSFECRVQHLLETGPDQLLVVGEVLAVHVEDAFVLDAGQGYIDTPALGLISRMHGRGWYGRNPDLYQLDRA